MRYLLHFILQIILIIPAVSQNTGSFIAQFNSDSLVKTVRELSGEDSVIINGTKTIIKNRAAYIGSPLGTNLTEQYLKARLAGYNITVQTQKYSIDGLNIFGIQKGTKYPDEVFIVGAHHDAATNYCADDNASGVATVLETARILSLNCFEYTVIYAFWDEEEAGLWGSTHYAKQAKANGQSFRGIITIDMLGYDSNNDQKFDIHVNNDPSSLGLADSLKNIINRHKLKLDPQIINPGTDRSDHYSFWKQGFLNSILYSERFLSDDPNPAYHTVDDRIDLFNLPYYFELSKLTIGLMVALAKPCATEIKDKVVDSSIFDARLYPNPTNSILTIEIGNGTETLIQVLDIFGRIIDSKRSTSKRITFDFSNYKNGIYIIALKDEKNTLIKKIIKTD
jgi:hypothetical protein